MTVRHPLFVANGTTGVTSPQDARLALGGLLTGPGIISGTQANVTGSSSGPNMKYIVPAETFATQRGTLAADGLYVWANDGAVTVDSGAPAPTSGTRYDVIYALARNANDGFGDANSDPVLGVVVGTAGSTPSVPAVPAGALALAQALVATNATDAASGATITQVAPLVGARTPQRLLWQYQKVGAQSIANGTFGTVLMDTQDIDTQNIGLSTGTFLGGFPAPVKGIYRCSGMVAFNPSTVGRRGTIFLVNATAIALSKTLQAATTVGAAVVPSTTALVTCNAGDVISFQAFQDSGSTLALAVPNGGTLTVELVQPL